MAWLPDAVCTATVLARVLPVSPFLTLSEYAVPATLAFIFIAANARLLRPTRLPLSWWPSLVFVACVGVPLLLVAPAVVVDFPTACAAEIRRHTSSSEVSLLHSGSALRDAVATIWASAHSSATLTGRVMAWGALTAAVFAAAYSTFLLPVFGAAALATAVVDSTAAAPAPWLAAIGLHALAPQSTGGVLLRRAAVVAVAGWSLHCYVCWMYALASLRSPLRRPLVTGALATGAVLVIVHGVCGVPPLHVAWLPLCVLLDALHVGCTPINYYSTTVVAAFQAAFKRTRRAASVVSVMGRVIRTAACVVVHVAVALATLWLLKSSVDEYVKLVLPVPLIATVVDRVRVFVDPGYVGRGRGGAVEHTDPEWHHNADHTAHRFSWAEATARHIVEVVVLAAAAAVATGGVAVKWADGKAGVCGRVQISLTAHLFIVHRWSFIVDH